MQERMLEEDILEGAATKLRQSREDVFEADALKELYLTKAKALKQNSEVLDDWERLLKISDVVCAEGRNSEKEQRMEYIWRYISVLERLVCEAEERKRKEDTRRFVQQLELMMCWKCCIVHLENRLLISPYYPIEMLTELMKEEAKQESKSELAQAVMESNYKNYFRYKIPLLDQIYVRDKGREQILATALPFRVSTSLTEISSIRLVEKVDSFLKNVNGKIASKRVRLACVGEIIEPKLIEQYYEEEVDVQLFVLKPVKIKDERLLFQVEDPSRLQRDEKKMFDFELLSDLEALFCQFDMVFFMDEGCFYNKRQSKKTLEERIIVPQLRWLHERTEKEDQISDKLLWMLKEYETIGQWLNTLNTDETAEFQFDEKLFRRIYNAITPEAHVYLYIGYGRQIGDIDLYKKNMCREENYDGKVLSVFKVPYHRMEDERESIGIQGFLKDANAGILIDVWKIVKSISNQYYKKFLGNTNEGEVCRIVHSLKKIFLKLEYKNTEQEKGVIGKLVLLTENEDAIESEIIVQVENFLQDLLGKEFHDEDNYCVYKYLHRLLGEAIISRSENVQGVLLGYLFKKGFFDKNIQWQGREVVDKQNVNNKQIGSLSEARRIAYSAIKGLADCRLRDYDRREQYLLFDFRNVYCPELDRETFLGLMEQIHVACENLGYKESSMYMYSNMRKDQV